eukprot:GCRY01001489.1.p1 GENE.GCRY01001489.1~~GCRY01001489.1.p1  ORF type:complete len:261 (+),score=69.18 GCRY01001489.1:165-947(+)
MSVVDNLKKENEKLRVALENEKVKNGMFLEEISNLKSHQANVFTVLMAEEEAISNKLLKKIDQLNKEKEKIVVDVEMEKEYITNMLTRKLMTMEQEKAQLEDQLNVQEKAKTLKPSLSSANVEDDSIPTTLEDALLEIKALKQIVRDYKSRAELAEESVKTLSSELRFSQNEIASLRHSLIREHSMLEEAAAHQPALNLSIEMDEEKQINEMLSRSQKGGKSRRKSITKPPHIGTPIRPDPGLVGRARSVSCVEMPLPNL